MDTRIEELTGVILERAEGYIKNSNADPNNANVDKHRAYNRIRHLANDILMELGDYRSRHIEDY